MSSQFWLVDWDIDQSEGALDIFVYVVLNFWAKVQDTSSSIYHDSSKIANKSSSAVKLEYNNNIFDEKVCTKLY